MQLAIIALRITNELQSYGADLAGSLNFV